jgi:hypothetical protein
LRIIRAGDGSPEGQRWQRVQELERQKRARYGGYDIVPAAAALEEIAQVIDPSSLGLQPIGDRRFAAPHGDFIRMVEVAAMKGAQYVIRWGVSLPYVPDGLKRPLRYGRTLKSARLNLWWGSHRGQEIPDPERFGFIGTFYGAGCVHDDAVAVWQFSRAAATSFWDRTRELPGVLTVATELMSAPGGQNWGTPLAGAVAALTAARLGLEKQAREFAAATPLRDEEAQIVLADLIDKQLAASPGKP